MRINKVLLGGKVTNFVLHESEGKKPRAVVTIETSVINDETGEERLEEYEVVCFGKSIEVAKSKAQLNQHLYIEGELSSFRNDKGYLNTNTISRYMEKLA